MDVHAGDHLVADFVAQGPLDVSTVAAIGAIPTAIQVEQSPTRTPLQPLAGHQLLRALLQHRRTEHLTFAVVPLRTVIGEVVEDPVFQRRGILAAERGMRAVRTDPVLTIDEYLPSGRMLVDATMDLLSPEILFYRIRHGRSDGTIPFDQGLADQSASTKRLTRPRASAVRCRWPESGR